MEINTPLPSVPVARALMMAPWIDHVKRFGEPVEALLVRSGIRPELLQHPAAAVPLGRLFRWLELACRSLGTEHLGLHVGCATSNEDLGPYGRVLAGALTLHQYLRQGVALYGTVVVGQSFRLSTHGSRVRVNLGAPWEPGLGDYQAHLHSFAVTIANIRRFAGPDWVPAEISLGFKSREALPAADIFGGTRVLHRPGKSYLEFPRAIFGLPLRRDVPPLAAGQSARPEPLPTDLAELVALQIEAFLSAGTVPIDLVAESLGTRRRSLQRGLAEQGVSYTDLLTAERMRRAVGWLECTDKPVVEIAFDLGYTDASNFTRAFRRQTGVSPNRFRQNTLRG